MIGRKRGCFSRFSCFSWVALFAFLTLGLAPSVRAETVEIAPGVQVTKRSYAAPINEQPFFGFADKTAAQREADDKFVQALLKPSARGRRRWMKRPSVAGGRWRRGSLAKRRCDSTRPISCPPNRAASIMAWR